MVSHITELQRARSNNEESIPLCIVKPDAESPTRLTAKKDLRIDSMVKPLSTAELAVLAAGPPTQRLDDFFVWKTERNLYDRLVRRQKKLAAQTVDPEPLRRSSRFEQKKLFVSNE